LIGFDKRTAPYFFLLPFLVFFSLFRLGPILSSIWMSLTQWDGIGTQEFIGLRNYVTVLSSSRFWTATYNTLFFTIVYNFIMISIALVLAVLLSSSLRGTTFFRSVYFSPIAMSLPVVAIVFDLILARNSGLLASIGRSIGINLGFRWFADPTMAMWAIVLMRIWRGIGYYCAYFLAGLTGIPEEIYESARVDGASMVTTFFKITLPLLRPVLLFVAVMSTILSFQIFDEPWILTQGGPADGTLMLQIYLYQTTFLEGNFGRGAAVSYLMTIFMMGASLLYVRNLSEKEQQS
jgi:ABC-type sugar transport system permease subunit